MPESVRDGIDGMLDGLHSPGDGAPGADGVKQPEREKAGKREAGEDPEAALRRARGRAFVHHARAVDAIFKAQAQDMGATAGQVRELHEARAGFDELRPHGSRDAEAVYKKNPGFAADVASGNPDRAASARRALQPETELRTDPGRRADRFVDRWQKLDQTSQRQYQAGDMSGYRSTRAEMGNMAKSLQRDSQMESLLANRKRDLGIGGDFDSGRSLGRALAFTHGLDLCRGRGIGLENLLFNAVLPVVNHVAGVSSLATKTYDAKIPDFPGRPICRGL